MKPIFTIHAGEYLVGEALEKLSKDYEVWIPAKDKGTDLLVTNKNDRSKNIGLQVKFSKDFLPEMEAKYHSNLLACGWWSLNQEKINESNADLWILAPYSFANKHIEFVIIDPKTLSEKLKNIHGDKSLFNLYLWITKDNKCFESRGLSKIEMAQIINNSFVNDQRDFTKYLNAWDAIHTRLEIKG